MWHYFWLVTHLLLFCLYNIVNILVFIGSRMHNVVGLPNDKTQWYSQAQTEISYSRDGDDWIIKVGVKGIPNGRVFRFKLGEPYDSADIDGSPMKSLIQACGNKFQEKHSAASLQGEEMEIERWIENDRMIVQTSCKGAMMKSQYVRVN